MCIAVCALYSGLFGNYFASLSYRSCTYSKAVHVELSYYYKSWWNYPHVR